MTAAAPRLSVIMTADGPLASGPVSLVAILAWALGELCGYVAGSGRSCDHVR